MKDKVAILYQSAPAPALNGIIKPLKEGGYSDSGADIACALQHKNVEIITPVENPDIQNNLDWVFPDSAEGIQSAIDKDANVLWLNTVLYKNHPIEQFIKNGIYVVGHNPENVEIYDDKLFTNALLVKNGLPLPKSVMVKNDDLQDFKCDFDFPVVVKPIRGRGSQGVSFVEGESELEQILEEMFASKKYGDAVYVEEFLPGQEITVNVLPPGDYFINGKNVTKEKHWSLPAVKRFNHENGIAPYNGKVAVVNNSAVLSEEELQYPEIIKVCEFCEKAAKLVGGKATIRIDCRANSEGKYFLFDLNMKPNMTGPSRLQRQDQDSLTALAARAIGWDYNDLVLNLLRPKWTINP